MEVSLITEFEDLMKREILPNLKKDNADIATEWVALIEKVRGFGPVKEKSVEQWRHKRNEVLDRFYGSEASAVHVVDLDQVV